MSTRAMTQDEFNEHLDLLYKLESCQRNNNKQLEADDTYKTINKIIGSVVIVGNEYILI